MTLARGEYSPDENSSIAMQRKSSVCATSDCIFILMVLYAFFFLWSAFGEFSAVGPWSLYFATLPGSTLAAILFFNGNTEIHASMLGFLIMLNISGLINLGILYSLYRYTRKLSLKAAPYTL